MIKVRVNEVDCLLFYEERIPPEETPVGYPYIYQLRHDEDNWICPISIERFVFVNFFGTIFAKMPFEIDSCGYLDVEQFEMEHGYVEFTVDRSILEKMFGL